MKTIFASKRAPGLFDLFGELLKEKGLIAQEGNKILEAYEAADASAHDSSENYTLKIDPS